MEVPQPCRVRRRDVDGRVVHERQARSHHGQVVFDGICSIAVRAGVQAHDPAMSARLQAFGSQFGAVVVEAVPIDDRSVVRKPEHARPVVAPLGLRRDRADFDEAETHSGKVRHGYRALVVASRESERIRQIDSGKIDLESLGLVRSPEGHQTVFHQAQRHAVRRFGINLVE